MATVTASYTSGLNIYYVIVSESSLIWNGSDFESIQSADWISYAIPLTEVGSGAYAGTIPTNLPAAVYCLIGYNRAGASPSIDDVPILFGTLFWDGSGEISGSEEGAFSVSVGDNPLDNAQFGSIDETQNIDVSFGTSENTNQGSAVVGVR